jgi:hypothetical protein
MLTWWRVKALFVFKNTYLVARQSIICVQKTLACWRIKALFVQNTLAWWGVKALFLFKIHLPGRTSKQLPASAHPRSCTTGSL